MAAVYLPVLFCVLLGASRLSAASPRSLLAQTTPPPSPPPAGTVVGASIRPLFGINYFPIPSDILAANPSTSPYWASDLTNSDFPALWSATGRDDIGGLAQRLLVNTVRSYTFNPSFNHISYLDYCHSQGLKVLVPIADYFLLHEDWSTQGSASVTTLINEMKDHPAVAAWGLTNELAYDSGCPNLNCTATLVLAAKLLISLDPSTRPVIVTSVYDNTTFGNCTTIYNAFVDAGMQAFLSTRYIAGLNVYFEGQDPATMGLSFNTTVTNFLATFPNTSMLITEYGASTSWTNNATLQSEGIVAQALVVQQLLATEPRFLGAILFDWQDDHTQTDNYYGVREYASSGAYTAAYTLSNQTYRVDAMQDKPSFAAFAAVATQVTGKTVPPPSPPSPAPPPSPPPLVKTLATSGAVRNTPMGMSAVAVCCGVFLGMQLWSHAGATATH